MMFSWLAKYDLYDDNDSMIDMLYLIMILSVRFLLVPFCISQLQRQKPEAGPHKTMAHLQKNAHTFPQTGTQAFPLGELTSGCDIFSIPFYKFMEDKKTI